MASWFSPSGPPFISSPNTSKYLSIDKVWLVSRADTKLVTGRDGIPKARKTVDFKLQKHIVNSLELKVRESNFTGSGDGGEDPALTVLDWFGSVAQVVLKDL